MDPKTTTNVILMVFDDSTKKPIDNVQLNPHKKVTRSYLTNISRMYPGKVMFARVIQTSDGFGITHAYRVVNGKLKSERFKRPIFGVVSPTQTPPPS